MADRIIVVCSSEIQRGKRELIVSHGFHEDTLANVVLQQLPPTILGAVFDPRLGEWVIESPSDA
jgi:hypothetical protein